jgi:glucose/arabinose dehydrogenase
MSYCTGSTLVTQLYGAPVGLAQDRQGALLIADDVSDAVWRVTAQAQ